MADPTVQNIDLEGYATRLLAAHTEVDAKAEDVVAWLSSCQIRRLEQGEVVCSEGDVGTELYVVLEGRVLVEKTDVGGQVRTVGSVSAPTLLGQMAMIDRARRTATCSAATELWLAVLDRDSYRKLIRSTDAAGTALRRLLLSSLTQQLLGGNARLGDLLEETTATAEPVATRDGIGGALLKASGLLEGWMSSGSRR
jgi:CRP/FNR family cyclic AMP-dependent transcriptional regulator